jgi:hypothetical protein
MQGVRPVRDRYGWDKGRAGQRSHRDCPHRAQLGAQHISRSEHRFPASVLIHLCHERWEIESAYLALRHTMHGGHVLRSGDRAGVEQVLGAPCQGHHCG